MLVKFIGLSGLDKAPSHSSFSSWMASPACDCSAPPDCRLAASLRQRLVIRQAQVDSLDVVIWWWNMLFGVFDKFTASSAVSIMANQYTGIYFRLYLGICLCHCFPNFSFVLFISIKIVAYKLGIWVNAEALWLAFIQTELIAVCVQPRQASD